MKKMVLCSVMLVLFAYGAVAAVAETGGACIRCHTDESLMKSLFVPPTIGGEEGEG